jgi:hypothetical protein
MIPLTADQRLLRDLYFLPACRPPHPRSHTSGQFAAVLQIVSPQTCIPIARPDLITQVSEQTDRTRSPRPDMIRPNLALKSP